MALSNMQKLFIEANRSSMDLATLSKETGATKKNVENYIKSLPKIQEPKPPKSLTASDFIHRHNKDGKQIKGVAMMTEEASSLGDLNKKRRGNTPIPTSRSRGCIAPSQSND